jgi:hypothetical protein
MKKIVISLLAALAVFMTTATRPAQATGNTCVYVFGTIAGRTVTTPGVLVPIPDTSIALDPGLVHVDETTQEILGYSLRLPGLGLEPEDRELYVPGVDGWIPSFTVRLNDLNLSQKTCVSFGVTTPAIPVHIPASALTIPGVVFDTPAIRMNVLGQQRTVGGQVIVYDGRTIVIPGVNTVVPPQTIETPDATIIADINGTLRAARYMAHR